MPCYTSTGLDSAFHCRSSIEDGALSFICALVSSMMHMSDALSHSRAHVSAQFRFMSKRCPVCCFPREGASTTSLLGGWALRRLVVLHAVLVHVVRVVIGVVVQAGLAIHLRARAGALLRLLRGSHSALARPSLQASPILAALQAEMAGVGERLPAPKPPRKRLKHHPLAWGAPGLLAASTRDWETAQPL